MRRPALFLVVIVAVAGVCLAGDNPVVGTWENVSVTTTATDGTTSESPRLTRFLANFLESCSDAYATERPFVLPLQRCSANIG